MGLDPKTIPPAMGSKMDPAERPAEVKTELTEVQEQNRFAIWLRPEEARGILWYDWSRTDEAVTCRVGKPDFLICLFGKPAFWIEFKAKGGRFSPAQKKTIDLLRELRHEVFIVQTADEAIDIVKRQLQLSGTAGSGRVRPG